MAYPVPQHISFIPRIIGNYLAVHEVQPTLYEAYRLDDILHRSEPLLLIVSHKRTSDAAIKGFYEVDAFEWDEDAHGGARHCKVMQCDLLPKEKEENDYDGYDYKAKLAIYGTCDIDKKTVALTRSNVVSLRRSILRKDRRLCLMYRIPVIFVPHAWTSPLAYMASGKSL